MEAILRYGGEGAPGRADMFAVATVAATKGLFKRMKNTEYKEVDNVYTQHRPFLLQTLEQLKLGKLSEPLYPFKDKRVYRDKPQDVVVFVVGGCTYEEARCVAQFNAENGDMRVILGGTCIHNFTSFRQEVTTAGGSSQDLKEGREREREKHRKEMAKA